MKSDEMDFEGEYPEGSTPIEVVTEEGDTRPSGASGDEITSLVAFEADGRAEIAPPAPASGDLLEDAVVVAEETPPSAVTSDASAEVLPARPRRRVGSWFPRFGRRAGIALVALFVLAFSGVAYATYDYDQEYDGKLLPGIEIAGLDVGGMTPEEAFRAVDAASRIQLDRNITVRYKEKSWTITPRKLGAQSDARALVDAAVAESEDTGLFAKASMAVLGSELDLDSELGITYPRQGIKGFIEGVAASLDRDPIDAGVDYSSGWLEFTPAKEGRTVLRKKSHRALTRALRRERDRVVLAVRTTKPEVAEHEWDQALLLRIGENKLYFYQDGKITHEYVVATGLPEYPTPTGEYEVTEKRYMPTWVNPDPDGWGASMPASIGPGPSNPLGTRALNWSAPAIRFHGTQATYSLGHNASHGCVRMSMPDVEELYDMVEVGTPIVSLIASPLDPMYESSPDPIPVAGDAN